MPVLVPCELSRYSMVKRMMIMTPNARNMKEPEHGRVLNHVEVYVLKQRQRKLKQVEPVDCNSRPCDSNVHWFVPSLASLMYNPHSHF